jgi:hypothetical protein
MCWLLDKKGQQQSLMLGHCAPHNKAEEAENVLTYVAPLMGFFLTGMCFIVLEPQAVQCTILRRPSTEH